MCGIVGYTGPRQAAPILLDGLEKLEYRGYDSAGIAVSFENKYGKPDIGIFKAVGRLNVLSEMTNRGRSAPGFSGIGHTRWATHGDPSTRNAHPHSSKDRRVAVVHNGIIENYREIADKLAKEGIEFSSDTDTEVVAHLLDKYYKGDPIGAISKLLGRIRGSYALGIIFKDRPGEIYAVRQDCPLIVGKGDGENFIASDVTAILKYTREVCYIQNNEIAKLTPDSITFYDIDCEVTDKEFQTVDWDTEAAEKGNYPHFMLKEIHEQPKAVKDTITPRIDNGRVDLSKELSMSRAEIKKIPRIQMVACGSAYHVCMAAKYVIESIDRIPVDVDLASEFRYRNPILEPDTLVIVVSQSGETADTLAALREAKKMGYKVLAIVNVVGSTIAREADMVLYTYAGPEIAVATTKAYSAQLAAVYLLAVYIGDIRGAISNRYYREMVDELLILPDKIERVLDEKERIQRFAIGYSQSQDIFFIGRGLDYAASLEGSLKLKEISYIHSEAYAAGELKHGTISLIEDGTLVIGVATQPKLFEKLMSNIEEVKSRGAYVLGLTMYGNYEIEKSADFTVYVPKTLDCFSTSLVVIPLQLLAYYVSVAKGLDVDKPRNLAKSVTVE